MSDLYNDQKQIMHTVEIVQPHAHLVLQSYDFYVNFHDSIRFTATVKSYVTDDSYDRSSEEDIKRDDKVFVFLNKDNSFTLTKLM